MKTNMVFLLVSAVAVVIAVALAPVGRKKGGAPEPIRNIAPAEAHANMQANPSIVLLDVRTPEEYAERHIPGSVLVPLAEAGDFIPALAAVVPDRKQVIYVYCRSGRRSLEAAAMIRDAGYANVYNLGGIKDWPFETR